MIPSSPEILLVSSPDSPITAYDASTGAILAHFTGSRSPHKGLALAGKNLIAASHISSNTGSGSVHLYNWWSSISFHHLPVPEPVAPITATPDGLFLFCGGLSGYIHALTVPSGDFLRSFPAHCKPVSCLTINDDGSLLISGSDDGTICVFQILRLLDSSSHDTSSEFALYCFTRHAASVTSITIGIGGCNSTIISCSLDCTCKFWSLAHGSHMRTVRFPCTIWGLVVDSTESNFFAGGSDGRVYVGVLKIDRRELVSGDDEVVAWTPEHSGAVMAVAMVNEGQHLVSASEDGIVQVWEVESGRVVRVLGHERGSISDLVVAKGIRDGGGCGIRLGSGGIEIGVQSLGFSGREISRPVREVSEMEEMLNVVVRDRRRALDKLDAAIGIYKTLLGLILKEANGGGSNDNSNTKDLIWNQSVELN